MMQPILCMPQLKDSEKLQSQSTNKFPKSKSHQLQTKKTNQLQQRPKWKKHIARWPLSRCSLSSLTRWMIKKCRCKRRKKSAEMTLITMLKLYKRLSENDALNWRQQTARSWLNGTSLSTMTPSLFLSLAKLFSKTCWSKKKSTKLVRLIICKKCKQKLKIRRGPFCLNGSSTYTENSNSETNASTSTSLSLILSSLRRKFQTNSFIFWGLHLFLSQRNTKKSILLSLETYWRLARTNLQSSRWLS